MSEAEKRKAELAEMAEKVQQAQDEIDLTRKQFSEARQKLADTKKAEAEHKKLARQAERTEKKQKRQDAIQKTKKELHDELERRKGKTAAHQRRNECQNEAAPFR